MIELNNGAPNAHDVLVGARIKVARKLNGMSQTQLGDGIGVSFQQIQKYEKGVNRISPGRLVAAAEILGVEPAFFFGEKGAKQTRDGNLSEEMAKIVELISSGEAFELNVHFQKIKSAAIRRKVINLVAEIAADSSD